MRNADLGQKTLRSVFLKRKSKETRLNVANIILVRGDPIDYSISHITLHLHLYKE